MPTKGEGVGAGGGADTRSIFACVSLAGADERNYANEILACARGDIADGYRKDLRIGAAIGCMSRIGTVVWIVHQKNIKVLATAGIVPGHFYFDQIVGVGGFVAQRNIDRQSKILTRIDLVAVNRTRRVVGRVGRYDKRPARVANGLVGGRQRTVGRVLREIGTQSIAGHFVIGAGLAWSGSRFPRRN